MELVARERFELSSSGPKPDMLDHYTNGLQEQLKKLPLFVAKGLWVLVLLISVPQKFGIKKNCLENFRIFGAFGICLFVR